MATKASPKTASKPDSTVAAVKKATAAAKKSPKAQPTASAVKANKANKATKAPKLDKAHAAAKLPKQPKAKAAALETPTTKLRQKLVRDSFTMPQADFDQIDALKARALAFLRPAKKSELLRAGLQALSALGDSELKAALESLSPLKVGRPKNSD